MDPKKAKEVLEAEQQRLEDLKQSKQVLEAERIRKLEEQQKARDWLAKQTYEANKKKFPKKACIAYTKCWNCGKVVELNETEKIANNSKVFRITECQCGMFNVDVVDCRPKPGSDYSPFVSGL